MYQALFFPLSSQRNKEAKKKKTPDLRLAYTWPHLSRKVASAIQGMDQHAVIRSFQIKSIFAFKTSKAHYSTH